MAKPIEVRLVGDGFALTDLLGPLLLALAAVGAAYLAAATAKKNHREQLENDRALRDREHIRNVLDEVAERSQASSWEIRDWDAEIEDQEKARSAISTTDEKEARGQLREIKIAVLDQAIALSEKRTAMLFDTIRLALRLGTNHEIVAAHDHWSDELDHLIDARSVVAERNRSAEEIEEDTTLEAAVRDASSSFLTACTKWFTRPAGSTAPPFGP
jgi:hypothetical protein